MNDSATAADVYAAMLIIIITGFAGFMYIADALREIMEELKSLQKTPEDQADEGDTIRPI